MDEIKDFSDERLKAWCIYCAKPLATLRQSRDHVPTKTLLHTPYPANLPLVTVCHDCNQSFRKDEPYLVAALSAILAGTTDPERQLNDNAARILSNDTDLRKTIEASKREFDIQGGEKRVVWDVDLKRIERVVVKNARGHAFYEYGEPMLDDPDEVFIKPIALMSEDEWREFEDVPQAGWPEVGSRMMTRVMSHQDMDGAWVVVQDRRYPYAVTQAIGGLLVRTIIYDYLATEVRWE